MDDPIGHHCHIFAQCEGEKGSGRVCQRGIAISRPARKPRRDSGEVIIAAALLERQQSVIGSKWHFCLTIMMAKVARRANPKQCLRCLMMIDRRAVVEAGGRLGHLKGVKRSVTARESVRPWSGVIVTGGIVSGQMM